AVDFGPAMVNETKEKLKNICLEYLDQEDGAMLCQGEQTLTSGHRRDGDSVQPPRACSAQSSLTRRLARPCPGLHCPQCGSVIYSRSHQLCGVCAHKLPGEVLFPAEEIQRLRCLMREERRRHRVWVAKVLNRALAPSFLSHAAHAYRLQHRFAR